MNNVIKRVWNQNRMVQIEDLQGMTFQAESGGHTFVISGVDADGNAVALSGTPSGVMLRPDDTDQALTCSVSGGKVYATLPAGCYDAPGRAGITIFLTNNGQKVAIYAAVVSISRTQSGTVAPGTTASVVDLINRINEVVATIPPDYSALSNEVTDLKSALSNVDANIEGLQSNSAQRIYLNQNMVSNHNALMGTSGALTTGMASHCVVKITDKSVKKITVPQIPSSVSFPAVIAFYNGSVVYFSVFSTTGSSEMVVDLPYDELYINWLGGETASPTFTYVDIQYRNVVFTDVPNKAEYVLENSLVTYKIAEMPTFQYKKYLSASSQGITISDSASHSLASMPSDGITKVSITLKENLSGGVTLAAIVDSNNDIVKWLYAQNAGEYSFTLDNAVTNGVLYVNLLNYTNIPNSYYDTVQVLNYTPVDKAYKQQIEDIVEEKTDVLFAMLQREPVSIDILSLPVEKTGYYMSASGSGILYTNSPSQSVYRMSADNVTKLSITIASQLAVSLSLMAVLDSNDNVVRYINGQAAGTYTIELPQAVENGYVLINLFSYATVPNPYYNSIDVINYELLSEAYRPEIKEIAAQSVFKTLVRKPFAFNGKTAVFTGDSITYGFTTGSTNVHGTGDYPTLFSSAVGLTQTNLAVGGAAFCSGHNAVKTIPEQIEDISTIPDFLFIAGGVNDWQLEVTLSELETTINNLCDYLNTNFPNIPIIWITPINEGGWETTHNIQPKATLQDFRDLITKTVLKKDTGARFSIIQGTDFNFPDIHGGTDYKTAMFGDLLHPTALGYKTLYVPGLMTALC